MKKRTSKFEPKTYLASKSDPNYSKDAASYAVRHIHSPAKEKKRIAKGALPNGQAILHEADVGEMKDDFVEIVARSIEKGWRQAPIRKGGATFSDEAADYVIKTIRVFGVDALRLSPIDEKIVRRQDSTHPQLTSLTRIDELGVSVCNVIRHWHDQVKKGNIEERRRARGHLKKVCEALIPDTRGKRGSSLTVPPLDILLYYYNEMFRLWHIQNALRPTSGSRSEKVKAASEKFEMPVELIREFWGLNEDYEILRGSGPFTLRDMARELTARRFKITHHALSNIIASYP